MASYSLGKIVASRGPAVTSSLTKWNRIPGSKHALNATNPLRILLAEGHKVRPNPEKQLINLHIGDPTTSGKLKTHPAVTAAIVEVAKSGNHDGYLTSAGMFEARKAVADSINCPETPVTPDDVIMTSAASHAILMCIEALAEPGQNILTALPGFPVCETHMISMNVQPRHYHLTAKNGWRIDLKEVESKIDDRTAAIIVNNPSNPTGAVFGIDQLEGLCAIAERYQVPIIADEIYGTIVYNSARFVPISKVNPNVPVLTCDAVSKRYVVPGWRLGWIVINDQQDALHDVRQGLHNLSHKLNGPSSLIQAALPAIMRNVPSSFFENIRNVVSTNAEIILAGLKDVPGLTPIRPYGSMFVMVLLDLPGFQENFDSEKEFSRYLIEEESVFCLPGSGCGQPDCIRLTLTLPHEQTLEACERIAQFAKRYHNAADTNKLFSRHVARNAA